MVVTRRPRCRRVRETVPSRPVRQGPHTGRQPTRSTQVGRAGRPCRRRRHPVARRRRWTVRLRTSYSTGTSRQSTHSVPPSRPASVRSVSTRTQAAALSSTGSSTSWMSSAASTNTTGSSRNWTYPSPRASKFLRVRVRPQVRARACAGSPPAVVVAAPTTGPDPVDSSRSGACTPSAAALYRSFGPSVVTTDSVTPRSLTGQSVTAVTPPARARARRTARRRRYRRWYRG
jgi:hypothetical protein